MKGKWSYIPLTKKFCCPCHFVLKRNLYLNAVKLSLWFMVYFEPKQTEAILLAIVGLNHSAVILCWTCANLWEGGQTAWTFKLSDWSVSDQFWASKSAIKIWFFEFGFRHQIRVKLLYNLISRRTLIIMLEFKFLISFKDWSYP